MPSGLLTLRVVIAMDNKIAILKRKNKKLLFCQKSAQEGMFKVYVVKYEKSNYLEQITNCVGHDLMIIYTWVIK